jgi:hypothetical protein
MRWFWGYGIRCGSGDSAHCASVVPRAFAHCALETRGLKTRCDCQWSRMRMSQCMVSWRSHMYSLHLPFLHPPNHSNFSASAQGASYTTGCPSGALPGSPGSGAGSSLPLTRLASQKTVSCRFRWEQIGLCGFFANTSPCKAAVLM